MILQTAIAIAGIGFVAYALGHLFNRYGVAMIGAIIVIGVGASIMTGGVQVAVGEDQVTINESGDKTVTNSTTVYEDVDTQSDFPVGVVVLALGAVMLIGTTGEASEQELEVDDE